jgi:NDP-sugar pyrophosphorylase family protein
MKAMILCAGFGTRLGELTRSTPKALLQVAGAPLIGYIILHLARHGFRHLAVNLHYQAQAIRDYLEDGSRFGVHVEYSYEPQLLGTAGGLKHMEEFFRDEEAFLVHYGDILTDHDFGSMLAFHRERDSMLTLLIHERTRSNSVVELDEESRVVGFWERPAEPIESPRRSKWVNSGVCICRSRIFASIPTDVPSDLPRDIFPRLLASRKVFGFPLSGYRCAIDSSDRLAEADQAIRNGHCSTELKVQNAEVA